MSDLQINRIFGSSDQRLSDKTSCNPIVGYVKPSGGFNSNDVVNSFGNKIGSVSKDYFGKEVYKPSIPIDNGNWGSTSMPIDRGGW